MRLLHAICCTLAFATPAVAQAAQPRDLHAHVLEASRAQIVMLATTTILPRDQASRIAQALRTAAREDDAPDAERTAEWGDLEARLTAIAGPGASDIHIGRSNNDLGTTINRMAMREMVLGHLERIDAARGVLHRMAGEHIETVMPGYTHGVQAQPTTLAHFLLAFDASLARDAERLRQVYDRLNRSPLGSGAFTTSSLPLDRPLLAELLGFEGLVENAYDAVMVSIADSKAEYTAALSVSALNVGRFVQYILFQYADPAPGMLLTGPLVSVSSSMPQKRNPSSIERLRLRASEVVANAHASALFVHNTPMYEVKDAREDHMIRLERYGSEADGMYEQLAAVLESLTIRPEILRAQVDRDYATMTELAEALVREARVPFRTAHRVASELTTYGRDRGKRPMELTHEEVAAAYHSVTGGSLPLTPEQVRRAFDPLEVVRSRVGVGGPQPAETRRMLAAQQQAAADDRAWTTDRRQRLARASEELGRRFTRLADGVL